MKQNLTEISRLQKLAGIKSNINEASWQDIQKDMSDAFSTISFSGKPGDRVAREIGTKNIENFVKSELGGGSFPKLKAIVSSRWSKDPVPAEIESVSFTGNPKAEESGNPTKVYVHIKPLNKNAAKNIEDLDTLQWAAAVVTGQDGKDFFVYGIKEDKWTSGGVTALSSDAADILKKIAAYINPNSKYSKEGYSMFSPAKIL
jgi:hypothetical protein